ncbi:MAG: aminotransferase class V-fold PLP-dependent enzyme [Candidatus Eisenbacteria bacterium]|nr:aminotransferase class V-fold PLP-dependent enzyme [Candidatus Eisenbacteria bacterium]
MEDEIRAAIDSVLEDSGFSNGPAVRRFEEEFAEYCGVGECAGTSSGTSALHLAMLGVGVEPGDEVVCVSMSFVATAWPVLYIGARAVFVDIDPESYTVDPDALERAVTDRTKAIVLVHLYGQCADMDRVLEIAGRRGIPVIEDCAHTPGADYKGRRAGSMGTVGCFSFYPTKNLAALGEAGAVTTDDPEVAERMRTIRDHGQTTRYLHELVGYNYRMDGLQGAVLSAKLRHLDRWNDARRAVAARYTERLKDTSLALPREVTEGKHVYHLYVVRDDRRDELAQSLDARGVATSFHYPIPIHLQPTFKDMGYTEGDLPVTEELARTCLSLPLYPELTSEQVDHVVKAVLAERG